MRLPWRWTAIGACLVVGVLLAGWVMASRAFADPNLIGEWHLDAINTGGSQRGFATINATTPDSSGHGFDLSVSGGVTVDPNGRFGKAFDFDGAFGLLGRVETAALEPQQMTVLAWVKSSGSPGSYKYVVAQGGYGDGVSTGCSGSAYALYTGPSGGLAFYVAVGGGPVMASPDAGTGLWDGQWHAVAGTYDGSTVRLYVDGNEVGAGSAATGAVNYAQDSKVFEIANYPGCTGFGYKGAIDEARVYNRALTAAEINYLQTTPGSTPPELPIPARNGPAVTTGQESDVTDTTATLHGDVNPGGSQVSDCHFDYGTSPAYGSSAPCAQALGAGSSPISVTAALSGLASGTTYDFRIVASNANGTSFGANQTLTTTGTSTPPPPPPPPGSSPPVARFNAPGPASTMKGGLWLNGGVSIVGLSAGIVDYAWDTNGDGTFDWHCGHSPIAAIAFTRPGTHTVGLKVTDSYGRSSVFTQRITVPPGLLRGVRVPTPTFDCENPAAGNQPDRADCVKSFGFGIIDANSRGEPNDCFQITSKLNPNALQYSPVPIAFSRERQPGATAAFKHNPFLIYHATLKGPVAVNGLYLPVPEANQSEYDQGNETITLGRVSVEIGPYHAQNVALDNIKVLPDSHGVAHVSDLFLKGVNAALGALPIKGSITVDLIYHASRTRFHLQLPPPFTLGAHVGSQGPATNGDVYVISDNETGIHLDGIRLGPLDAFIGPVYVKSLAFKFLQSQDLWEGSANIVLPGSPVTLDAAQPPPDAGFGLRNGHFDHAGVGLDFLPGAQPELFPGIFLTNIHVALGTNPLRFTGGGAIAAGDVLKINGDLFVAFATPDNPYNFPTDEAAGDLAPLAGRTFDSFTIAIGGTASLDYGFGQIGLANAHALYEYPDFVEVGADYSLDLVLVKFSGNLNGFMLPSERKYSFESEVTACPNFKVDLPIVGTTTIDKPCFGAGVALSTVGVGLCGTVPIPFFTGAVPVTITVGYKWGGSVDLSLFSCDLGPYQEANPRAAAADAPQAFTLPGGLPSAMVRITGRGAAPDVTLTGPRHEVISTSKPPQDPSVIVLRNGATTLIALKHPVGGKWLVATEPGSAPVTGVAFAAGLPAPHIEASVSGGGPSRTLRYRVLLPRGMQIAFAERGARSYKLIGQAHTGHGQIQFVPAAGRRGQREILALIVENGIVRRSIVVARYRAPGPSRPGRPGNVRVAHHGTTVSASWSSAAGAADYAIILTTSDGERTLQVTRKRTFKFTGITRSAHGSVTVMAFSATGLTGAGTVATFTRSR
jgi:Concanavalin A-like lectin/glucanases superfamily/PKD domain